MNRKRIICWIVTVLLALSPGGIMNCNQDVKVSAASVASDVQIQARGVWHRPNITGVETDLAGICSVLDTLQRAGINLVFLETFYHGMTVYRTNLIPYYTGFDAFDYSPYPDYLSAFVAEAGKRGIEVHAWVEDFYIGVDENYFTKYLPQWLMVTQRGTVRQTEGADYGGYLFLDPANPEVRQYLIRFYDELLTKFPEIAGLNLDYIRYPISSSSDDTGFTEAAMAGFAEENGLTFPEDASWEDKVKLVKQDYGKWVNYRAGRVTAFVGEVYEMVKQDHPGVLLSTAVFPEQGKSFGDKKQDFNTWLSRGYLDIITPMAYYDDIATLKSALNAMLPGLADCYCYAGISPTYHDLSNEQVLAQMQTTEDVGADGFVFFGSQSILNAPNYIQLLEETLSDSAILPHAKAKQLLERTAQRVEQALTAANEPAEKVGELTQLLKEMDALADDADPEKMEQVYKKLQLLVKYNLGTYVSEENLDMARQELTPLLRWIRVKTTRLQNKVDVVPDAPNNPDVPEEPQVPQDSPAAEQTGNNTGKLARNLGLGAAIAALAAATAAFFHIRRKGRNK